MSLFAPVVIAQSNNFGVGFWRLENQSISGFVSFSNLS